ncbi:hypothetical protein DMENIID0001_095580 [Sergentomyia squamirostris]
MWWLVGGQPTTSPLCVLRRTLTLRSWRVQWSLSSALKCPKLMISMFLQLEAKASPAATFRTFRLSLTFSVAEKSTPSTSD